jgi:hypothetical protein
MRSNDARNYKPYHNFGSLYPPITDIESRWPEFDDNLIMYWNSTWQFQQNYGVLEMRMMLVILHLFLWLFMKIPLSVSVPMTKKMMTATKCTTLRSDKGKFVKSEKL